MTPYRVALTELSSGQRYTYADLNIRANRLANFLLNRLGIQKGDRISILAHNSVAYVDLFYGIGKIGAILTPLNWRLVARELLDIITDCQPKVLICGPEFTDLLNIIRPNVDVAHYISLENADIKDALSYEKELTRASGDEPTRFPIDNEDPYCILYTSGTTGRPKGAVIPHRQVLWNCINTVVSWSLTDQDVSPVFTPLFHAGGLFAFLTPIFYIGGQIILSRVFDIDTSLKVVEQLQCTVILGVPTIFQMWMESPVFSEVNFNHARWFISGGASCPVSLITAWHRAKKVVLRQGYGLTEVGVNCCTMTDEESISRLGSVGKPIFHSRMRIVDEKNCDVTFGHVGELIISGPHVFTGYWNNPHATAEALHHGWFYTGDAARIDEEGFIYIVGRYKDMIISGGENIYAAEVEAVVKEHPAVADAALIGEGHEKWGEIGVIIIVRRKGYSLTEKELLTFCKNQLARYKIPKKIIFTDILPYSPYGKVLKEKLKNFSQTKGNLK